MFIKIHLPLPSSLQQNPFPSSGRRVSVVPTAVSGRAGPGPSSSHSRWCCLLRSVIAREGGKGPACSIFRLFSLLAVNFCPCRPSASSTAPLPLSSLAPFQPAGLHLLCLEWVSFDGGGVGCCFFLQLPHSDASSSESSSVQTPHKIAGSGPLCPSLSLFLTYFSFHHLSPPGLYLLGFLRCAFPSRT